MRNFSLFALIPLLLTVATLELYDNFCPARQFAPVFKFIELSCALISVWCAITIVYWRCKSRVRKKLE